MSHDAITLRGVLEVLGDSEIASSAIAARFGVTRQAIHTHLKKLEEAGLVEMVGAGRGARWKRMFMRVYEWPISADAREDQMWRQVVDDLGAELGVSAPARSILNYGVTEMINNALDHSDGVRVTLSIDVGDSVVIAVSDDGIGAFERVREYFRLRSHLDAIAHMSKGQQTTDPTRHSGRGIHFTSRAFDRFSIESCGFIWKRDNIIEDSAVGEAHERPGTRVTLTLDANTERALKDVFDAGSRGDGYEFDHTVYPVLLADFGDQFMSRSEAKRITDGLERYREVGLDFNGVNEIGQGFVDEVFRVWAQAHPDTRLTTKNAIPAVQFMIDRGITH